MNLAVSERTKHRLIGILVLVSIGVIFLPAIMKKSNKHFEKNIRIALKLPSKPELPNVDAPNNRALFKQVKVASAPAVEVPKVRKNSLIAKASSLNPKLKQKTVLASASSEEVKPALKKVEVVKTDVETIINTELPKQIFSIQVATFTQQSNADILVEKLRDNGFVASYNTIDGERGNLYQVIVGKLSEREKAVDLQKRLVTNMQLNGFIIKSGVS
jgi:DedD protein